MFNLVSLVIGVVTLPLVLVALFPLLGWANWFILPVAVVGLLIGLVSRHRAGQTLNLVVIIICVARLILGGGIL